MKKIFAIACKEVKSLFNAPMAYIVLVITVTVFNFFFFLIIDENREASLRDMFKLMEFMFVFIAPLLTMKIFAEEKLTGTMEFLATTPTTNSQVVLGKFFGILTFYTFLIMLTGIYYVVIEAFSSIDIFAMLSGYLGIWLEGAFFIAIGLMTSSWTPNQIIAALSSYVILISLYISISLVKYLSGSGLEVIRAISSWSHSQNLFAGIISTCDVMYFLSGILVCLLITRLSIENRLWR